MGLKECKLKGIATGLILLLIFQLVMPNFSVLADDARAKSAIGGIEITVKKESEIQSLLVQAVIDWKGQPIVVQGRSGVVEVPTDLIHFNIEETVTAYINESKAPWYMPWKKSISTQVPLVVEAEKEMNDLLGSNPFILIDETHEAILEHARYLKTGEVVAQEREVTKEFMDRTAFEIQPIPKSSTSMSALVAMLDGMVLAKDETFSFLTSTAEIAGATDIEARRFFASVLYSVVLQAETSIVERHSQSEMPAYLQPGIEVDVSSRLQKDFAFNNRSQSPMVFGAKIDNNHLVIELYMLKNSKKVTYAVVETAVEPRKIYRLSSALKSKQQRVVEAGESGYRATVYRTIMDDYDVIEEEVSKDFYPPTHKIIEVSTQQEVPVDSKTENKSSEKSDYNSSNDTKDDDNKNSHPKEESNTNPNKNDDEPKDSDDPVGDSEEKEVIYDKGGNVIYDPNA